MLPRVDLSLHPDRSARTRQARPTTPVDESATSPAPTGPGPGQRAPRPPLHADGGAAPAVHAAPDADRAVEAEPGRPRRLVLPAPARPAGLHRRRLHLRRRLAAELAVQARDGRHLVLRRGQLARRRPCCCRGWWPSTAAWSSSSGSGSACYQTLRARPGVPIRPLAYMLALWILPLLVVAPLFSRDVFSYAAQGEMMSHHINPYHYGPGTLGSGPYVSPVDTLWLNTPAPYGPLFLMLAGWSASLSLPPRAVHRRPAAPAVGGRRRADRLLHPQAGPLVRPRPRSRLRAGRPQPADPVGARRGRAQRRHHGRAALGRRHGGAIAGTRSGASSCARWPPPSRCPRPSASSTWPGTGPALALTGAGAPASPPAPAVITVAVMGVLSLVSGLGWGWIANLGTPGTVRSWMAPATAVGLLISGAPTSSASVSASAGCSP